jgi:mRNA-degrading endonuclease RelE of RelBE toxin-antitoxin system
MTTIPLADAKARLSAVLDEVRDTHDRVVITRNGRGGYHSARRGAYRMIYRIDETERIVHVVRIDHRADVYGRFRPTRPAPYPVEGSADDDTMR